MKEVSVHELKKMMDEKNDFQLIDVREPGEHEFCNIGGELIPMGNILQNTDKIDTEKDVIIYCRSGNRSANIIRALEQHFSYTNLINLKGGILEWADEIDSDIPKY